MSEQDYDNDGYWDPTYMNIGMSGQAYGNHLGAVMTEDQRKRRTAKLNETRQLKQPGACYLTGLEPSGKYTSYFGGHDDYEKGFMEGHSSGLADGMNIIERRNGVDLDRFKRECEEIENE